MKNIIRPHLECGWRSQVFTRNPFKFRRFNGGFAIGLVMFYKGD